MIDFTNNGNGSLLRRTIRSYRAYKVSERMEELIELMVSEKKVVDANFGDWDKVSEYLFKAKSTMKVLRFYNNKLNELNE